ncbi:Uma2 family endonuclease [Leptolyngbya sp. FACHB-36]|uniref:Uma2 family endonuclease n=1 Tax=Leptolyngbya sp. FACHB-36 TaxID=2692808 RepID=UPI0016804FC7|nr:Uma2 family endonuclease [Leptolyngbya sp. FACHB-36]MBD2020824.1 Uma2 family endonuclease [Leptolyngbya sp. FACHB-36]
MVTLQLRQLDIPPGQRVLFRNVEWAEYEAILAELGEHRSTRLAYSEGTLEIVAPLPEHEKAKVVIGDLLKALLDELDMNWESLGSTTFRREEMSVGIEPDDCFYIQNHALMIGRDRIDLTIDPPPDLAIEIDVTSKTRLSAYEALQGPEIWRYQNRKLQINVLQAGKYVESQTSPMFPNLPVLTGISQYLEMSRTAGTAPAIRAFRRWVRKQLQ